ncbi:MAG: hypothetical protein PWQ55_1166 [Chloroflexota bacterium]|nr:hypothetical protein [Chloroflexota bacterium]
MKLNKAAILSLAIFDVMAIDSIAPLIQKISSTYPLISPTVIKLTVTLPSLIAIIFSLLSGQLVRWLSKKWILLIAMVFYSIGGLGAGAAQNFTLHLCLRSLVGAGAGLITPIRTSLIGDFYQGEERANMFGKSLALSKFVAIIIPPLSVWLGSGNWRNAFFIYLFAPLILVFSMTTLDIPFKNTHKPTKHGSRTSIPPSVFMYAIAALLVMCVFFILVTDLSYLIDLKANISPKAASFGLSTATLGTTLAGLFFVKFHKKLMRCTIPFGLAACGIGFLLFSSSQTYIPVFLGLFLAGFGLGILLSILTLLATNAVGEADSTPANSLVNCGVSLGIFLSAFFFERVPIIFKGCPPIQSNFYLASVLFLGASCLSFLLLVKKSNHTQGEKHVFQ